LPGRLLKARELSGIKGGGAEFRRPAGAEIKRPSPLKESKLSFKGDGRRPGFAGLRAAPMPSKRRALKMRCIAPLFIL